VRLFVLTRHAHSTLNLERRVNGDPARPVGLTDEGREQARLLGLQLAHVPLELCVHTRFGRTRETAELALAGRGLDLVTEPLLDDIDVGELEGESIDSYRAWKRMHTRADPFPGGETLDDAARRYAEGYRRLLERPERAVLVVCHEIPLRYAVNAAAGSAELDGPVRGLGNAIPFAFDEAALQRAANRIDELAGGATSGARPA
jgi:broad specificity phosphatase PhoE